VSQARAGSLYDSLHDKLLRLPDETVVWPGHGAGSACGRSLSSDTSSTIGRERRENSALQLMSREAFIADLTANQPAAPASFPRAAALTKSERATLEESLEQALVPLDLAALRAASEAGAQVLDVRPKDAHAAGHLPGSFWIGLDGRFASWAGTLLDLERDVVLVAEPGSESEAALRLMRIGIDQVRGYLQGGIAVVPAAELESTRRIGVQELAAARGPLSVLDVRTPGEWAAGHLAGSQNLPLAQLRNRIDELPSSGRVFVHCKTGYRSLIATSLLAGRGSLELIDVAGGYDAWVAAALPVDGPASTTASAS
jgi:rhodanese-related sulfurtransferase